MASARDRERAVQAWGGTQGDPVPSDFIGGFMAGVDAERVRTREYVTPANLALYDLMRMIDDDPSIVDYMRLTIPETMAKLVKYLETGVPS